MKTSTLILLLRTCTRITVVPVFGRGADARQRLLVRGAVHRQLAHVLLRLEDDDVHLGREEAQQRHVRRQRDRDAQRCRLDLKQPITVEC